MDPDNLYSLAEDLLSAVVNAFSTAGVALPARQYLTTGEPAADCDSLVVSFTQMVSGTPATPEASRIVIGPLLERSALFTIWRFRCVSTFDNSGPMGNASAPNTTALNADARAIMKDSYVMYRGIGAARALGTFRDRCENLALGPALALNYEGGIGGVQMQVTAELS